MVLKDDFPTNGFKKIERDSDLEAFSEETKSAAKRYRAVNPELYLNTAGFPEAVADILKIAQ